ncbi:MAG: twin-arginine translocase subunit TatC [Planctomycetota bacterium]
MLRKPDEDLFEASKMSFGEHLEELRGTLWKAILALAIGCAIGLLPPVGGRVVKFVGEPLKAGLKEFRKKQATEAYERFAKEQEEAGVPGAENLMDGLDDYLKTGLVPGVYRVDPEELLRALRDLGVATDDAKAPAVTDKDGLLPLTLFTPLDGDRTTQLIATNVLDGFLVYVKAALLVGALLASPAVFYFLWSFVASGLYRHERSYIYIFLPFSIGLFLLGAGVAFYFAIGLVLQFLFGFFAMLDIDPTPRISEWLSFVLLLPIGFGVAFQLPLVMLFLERIGVFTVPIYLSYWRIAVLVIFILSMLLTPADPGSMLLLAVPLTGLYFGGVALCRFMPRRKTPLGDAIA